MQKYLEMAASHKNTANSVSREVTKACPVGVNKVDSVTQIRLATAFMIATALSLERLMQTQANTNSQVHSYSPKHRISGNLKWGTAAINSCGNSFWSMSLH